MVTNSLGFGLTEDKFRAMFDKIDADGNGLLSRHEFLKWFIEHRDNSGADPTNSEEKSRKLFSIFGKVHS